jgi:hypothetical protein
MEYIRNNFLLSSSSSRDGNRDIELSDLESGTSGASSHLLPAEDDMQLDANRRTQLAWDLSFNFLSPNRDSNSDVGLHELESGTSAASLPAEVDMQLDANEKRQMDWDLPVFKKVRIVPQASRIPTVVSVRYS